MPKMISQVKPNLSPDARAILQRIQQRLRTGDGAAHYDQNDWWRPIDPEKFDAGSVMDPVCGTTCCIAGWIDIEANGVASFARHVTTTTLIDWDGIAADALGIPPVLLDNLTGDSVYWPLDFASRYARAETDLGRAEVAADRIEAFIVADGFEGDLPRP